MRYLMMLAAPLCITGCMTAADREGASGATTTLAAADGSARGAASLSDSGSGLRISVQARDLPAGTHGIHVHAVGRCEAPDFGTAGPHWNPTERKHGRDNPEGAHHGDMPNIDVGADGRGSLAFTIPATTLAALLDADGAALVIHANADDYRTDPSGNSGGRIACGVIARS